MSLHFSKVKIKAIKKETKHCVSIAFEIPESLKESFKYSHGQHLTLRSFINGEEVRHSLFKGELHKE